MDKKKQSKEEKVGPDGLTKKERRALKVQARQTDDNKAELKNIKTEPSSKQNDTNIKKNTETCVKEKSEEKTLVKAVVEATVKPSSDKTESGLSEKEKRKLEWEKRLAEEKNKLNKVDSKVEGQSASKAQQKAKRREIQEAQRLAKAKADGAKVEVSTLVADMKKVDLKVSPKPTNKVLKLESAKPKVSPLRKSPHYKKQIHSSKVQLLHHLYLGDSKSTELQDSVCLPNIHPAFIQLGVQYSTKTISGSNARSISLLGALNSLIRDLKTPPQQEFCRYLESVLQCSTDYLQRCRPMAVSMINVLRLFKLQLTQIDTNISDEEKKKKLLEFINGYITDQILTAGKAISLKVLGMISNSGIEDIILTYGCSSLIKRILVDAFEGGKQFKVIVVDSRPLFEGREMLRRLTEAGIECTYILINALSYVMPKVTKVLLGAHALLANGYVMSRTGTAQVALVAQAYTKSVLVCCETYKFSEKVQMDSLVYNEIGDPDKLLNIDSTGEPSPLSAWRESNKLTPLNLLYDFTPPDLVTAVVTELRILPCTSVPVVLRIKPTEI